MVNFEMVNLEEVIIKSKASIEKDDLKVLLPLIAKIEPQFILEIGTWKGYSALLWEQAFGGCIVTIEKTEELDIRLPAPAFYIKGDSHSEQMLEQVKNCYPNEQYDFLFIDGDHSYEGVKKDFEMYAPLVRKGGIIIFHDAIYHADETEEVDIFWHEIKNQYSYVEIKVGKNSTGIGVIWV